MDTNTIERARRAHLARYGKETWFERALFLSWHCKTADCKFCYMSLIRDSIPRPELARRRWESVLAETVLCRELGWQIGFISAGTGAYSAEELARLASLVKALYGKPVCVNAGAFSRTELELLKDSGVDAVCASVESVNWELREELCPSKPIHPYLEMLTAARELGMRCVMTLILGIGETRKDYAELKRFITEYAIDKIVLYGIVPHEGSQFNKAPDPEEMAWWIANIRLDFPEIGITAGIWHDRADDLEILLAAGANAFTKWQAVKHYGKESARQIVQSAEAAERTLSSALASAKGLARVERALEHSHLDNTEVSEQVFKDRLRRYLNRMQGNMKHLSGDKK